MCLVWLINKIVTFFEQLIEPSELERGFHTDVDQEIRTADMPERFQLRSIPVCPTEDGELDEEAEWIYKYAFAAPPISQQDLADQSEGMSFRDGRFQSKSESYVIKIKKALNFMRNQQFEVCLIFNHIFVHDYMCLCVCVCVCSVLYFNEPFLIIIFW